MNLLETYRQMVKIRAFEEKLSELFSKGLIGGTSHFCMGQEASAVGIAAAARPTTRSHTVAPQRTCGVSLKMSATGESPRPST